jgi:RNA polymerase sigma factor (sigma-70 family)
MELEAFETLFREFQGDVYGWIVRIVRNPALAEDLTIETFWRVYRSREQFHPERSFGAWVRRIATNVAIDHLRGAGREVELVKDVAGPELPDPERFEHCRRSFKWPLRWRWWRSGRTKMSERRWEFRRRLRSRACFAPRGCCAENWNGWV